jgi:hypothetical protein
MGHCIEIDTECGMQRSAATAPSSASGSARSPRRTSSRCCR